MLSVEKIITQAVDRAKIALFISSNYPGHYDVANVMLYNLLDYLTPALGCECKWQPRVMLCYILTRNLVERSKELRFNVLQEVSD